MGRLRWLFGRARAERELDEEMRVHLEMETEKNRRAGMSELDARAAARRAFGELAAAKEDVRASWGLRLLDDLRSDVRIGARALRRDKGFTFVVILTLALGVGANTAIFSVVNGILLRPLPFADGDRIVRVQQEVPRAGRSDIGFSPLEVTDVREGAHMLDGVAEYHSMWFNLLGRGEPLRVQTGVVSANWFDVLGVKMAAGRGFLPGEDAPGAPPVLVLSYGFWQRAFGGDPGIVGQTFEMNDKPHVVVGVLPPLPPYPDDNDVWMPTSACPFRGSEQTIHNRKARISNVIGRLAPGATLESARKEVDALIRRWPADHPADYDDASSLRGGAIEVRAELTEGWKMRLWLLLGVAVCVLLIVCANIANLTLARGMKREHEMAVRAALGAGRNRLLRHLLTEGLLLSFAGAAVGLAVAMAGHELLVRYMARFTPRAAEIQIDVTVVLFTLGLALATGLVFVAIPALPGRRDVASSIKEEGARGATGPARRRLRGALVVAQVAFSFMVLVGAGLALRSLDRLQRQDPGFRTDHVLTMRLDLDWSRFRGQENQKVRLDLWDRIYAQVAAGPGVTEVAAATTYPLNQLISPFSGQYLIEGSPATDKEARPKADLRIATGSYFHVIGMPLVAGRSFDPRDTAEAEQVVVVNQAIADKRLGGAETAVGRRISFDDGKTWNRVVGVVGDVRQYGLDRPPNEEMYLPPAQNSPLGMSLMVRTAADPMTVARQVREDIRRVDPRQPVAQVQSLDDARAATLATPRATTAIIALFALLAVLVTAAGIGGVLALLVTQRSKEIAVRVALGARKSAILGLILRQGLSLVLVGLSIGAAGALALGHLMGAFLYQVRPSDPLTFGGVAALLAIVAAAASLLPARRAAGIDPMQILRTGG